MRFERHLQSWTTIMDRLYPSGFGGPPDDIDWAEMQRLRGLVMVQAAETEAVIGEILRVVSPGANLRRPAGVLLTELRYVLDPEVRAEHEDTLQAIARAIAVRNRVVHERVVIGATWVEYRSGGGEYQAVISLMGGEEYDERKLVKDFDVQVEATTLAVGLLHAVETRLVAES